MLISALLEGAEETASLWHSLTHCILGLQVLVLRLMTEGSVEKHIIQVAEKKKRFADSSITGDFHSSTR